MAKKRGFLTLLLALVMAIGLTVPAWAGVTDVTGGGTSNTYKHTYHTKVEAKAEFYDASGNVTTTIDTETGDKFKFGFREGNLSDKDVQGDIAAFYAAVDSALAESANYKLTKDKKRMTFDHFESSNIIETDKETLDVHEYQIYKIELEYRASDNICVVYLDDATLSFNVGDAPKFTASVSDRAPYTLGVQALWNDGNGCSEFEAHYPASPNDKLTAFTANQAYRYSTTITAKDGLTFADNCEVYLNGIKIDLIKEHQDAAFARIEGNGTKIYLSSPVTIDQSQSAPRYYYNSTTATNDTNAPQGSPKTFDPGVAVYALSGLLSLGGLTAVARKRGR